MYEGGRDLTSLILIHVTLLMGVTVAKKVASALLLFSHLEKIPSSMPQVYKRLQTSTWSLSLSINIHSNFREKYFFLLYESVKGLTLAASHDLRHKYMKDAWDGII